jgi:hypothetical protein
VPIRVTCPGCNHAGQAPREFLGHSVTCRRCGVRFTIAPTPAKSAGEEDTIKDDMPDDVPEVPPAKDPAQKKSRT